MRNFINEHSNRTLRELNDHSVLRNTSDATSPGASRSPGQEHEQQYQSRLSPDRSPMQLELPETQKQELASSSPMSWFRKSDAGAVAEEHGGLLKVTFFALCVIVALIIFSAVATQSGSKPDLSFPRLLFFMVDGVTVDEFKAAAALRRAPSMEFFASQSENCRPTSAESLSKPVLSECTMSDPATRVGTVFSLMTGQSFDDKSTDSDGVVSLHTLQAKNFSTFLGASMELGLTTAVLGSNPLVTTRRENTAGDDDNKLRCGIVDIECQVAAANTRGRVKVPPCTVPPTSDRAPEAMTSHSTSCNTAFQGLIGATDSPQQIWERLEYVLKSDVDVIMVQIPEATVHRWRDLHRVEAAAASGASEGDNDMSMDAALFSVDALFSKILKEITVQSVEQGEQWLSFLAVSSPREQNIMLASNIVASGQRQDVPMIDDVGQALKPHLLFEMISKWLRS